MANSAPLGGRKKISKYPKNEEEIGVFYYLAPTNEEEIRNFGQNIYLRLTDHWTWKSTKP